MSDDRHSQFATLEFQALRAEILALRQRVVQILSLGLGGIPLLAGAGDQFELDALVFASPFVAAVFILMLLYEQNSIMRAGRYIRLHLEPVLTTAAFTGWEMYLEAEPKNRFAERLFSWAAYLAFGIYYVGGTVFSFFRLADILNNDGWAAVLIVSLYTVPFFAALIFVCMNFPTGTTRQGDNDVAHHLTQLPDSRELTRTTQ